MNFNQHLTDVCSLGWNKQYSGIGSDNGMVPKRQQAIIWSNVRMLHWYIYAPRSLNDLKHPICVQYASVNQTIIDSINCLLAV